VRLPVGEAEVLDLQALDVSIGGLSMLAKLPADKVEIGTRFPGATVQVGTGTSSFPVELELRNCNTVRLRNGTDTLRAGFMFVDLPDPAEKEIQRYLMRVERERRSREAGLGR
jgi:c-di-GMP-binding flagellar brake protein YcgR